LGTLLDEPGTESDEACAPFDTLGSPFNDPGAPSDDLGPPPDESEARSDEPDEGSGEGDEACAGPGLPTPANARTDTAARDFKKRFDSFIFILFHPFRYRIDFEYQIELICALGSIFLKLETHF
jgi:hypothetical protein